ncbi:hypothetical protein [Flavobacterium sp.]|uniref:hypothetical protein n=1 Tax=Flavobacterium sp. TaxID=239 RepID=UPI0008C647CE|nr:hypothetical protein [Flavobacterium sp.]OGS61170.1 MAG: hypothetical protein A2X07_05910 [Flavobacteria bacterium GWF1_32_7]HBD27100.1 hypothetical protein [Flavobacterium sp.]
MRKICLIISFLFSVMAFSQDKVKNLEVVKGTFQLEILKMNVEPVSITSELLEKIDELRKETELVYLQIDEVRRIKIFSRQDIIAGKNKNIEEFVLVTSFKN